VSLSRIVLAALGAAACSSPRIGDGGGDPAAGGGGGASGADAAPAGDPTGDVPELADGGSGDPDDECYTGPLRRLELLDATASTTGSGADAYYGLTAGIDGVPVGVFYLDLYGGVGSLAAGVGPGTYSIAGDDTNWSDCALCVWASFGISEERWVMAQSGTVRIDRADSRLAGSLAAIELVEIDEADQPVAGGCRAVVEGIGFDVPVE
jgi:hypothetical protein